MLDCAIEFITFFLIKVSSNVILCFRGRLTAHTEKRRNGIPLGVIAAVLLKTGIKPNGFTHYHNYGYSSWVQNSTTPIPWLLPVSLKKSRVYWRLVIGFVFYVGCAKSFNFFRRCYSTCPKKGALLWSKKIKTPSLPVCFFEYAS